MSSRRSSLIATILIAFIAIGAASPASAYDSAGLSQNLGDVLAAEGVCGLTFDQAALAKWIDEHVRPDDMEFIGNLNMHVYARLDEYQALEGTRKALLCQQTTRVARSLHFMK